MTVDVQKNRELLNTLIKDNDIDEETQKLYRNDLDWFINNHMECKYEDDLEHNCHQKDKGYMDSLDYENGRFYQVTKPCEHLRFQENKTNYLNKFLFSDFNPLETTNSLNIELFSKKWKDAEKEAKGLGISEKEFEVKSIIVQFFITRLKDNKLNMGFYLVGPMGVGKTTLFRLLAIYAANEFSKTIAFSNVANLSNKLKEGFNNDSSENIISKMQNADILFLDDIGGETATVWLRDDVLYTILNFRMNNNKPTFFTSNMTINELAKHYQLGKPKPKQMVTKDERLMERINVLAKELVLDGKDHRKKN